MRRTGLPGIAGEDGQYRGLKKVAFDDKRVAEEYLQQALDQMPNLLPVEEVESSYAPIVSLGREIDNIDNLFISPAGRITLVETKLYRNPEAVREVVAQILDYATRLSKWSYEEFEAALQKGMSPCPVGPDGLYAYVAKQFPDEVLPEDEFIDAVQKNLRTARFLLMVVGDGIRESVEQLLGHLHGSPQMLYTFALVEMQIYENPEVMKGRLILPVVVARTTEVVRSIVRVHTEGPATVDVTVEKEDVAKRSAGRRNTLSEDEFFSAVADEKTRSVYRRLLDFAGEIGAELSWGSSAVSIKLPDPGGSSQNLTLFYLQKDGIAGTGWLADQLKKISLPSEIESRMIIRLQAHFYIRPQKNNSHVLYLHEKASVIAEKIDIFMDIFRQTVDEINRASEDK